MRVLEITSPWSRARATATTLNPCDRPYSLRSAGVPAPPCPNLKFSPTNTARAPKWSDRTVLQNASGVSNGELLVERDDHQFVQPERLEQFLLCGPAA